MLIQKLLNYIKKTENVIINFNTSISAALFSPSLKEEKSDTLMLLMPIRLND